MKKKENVVYLVKDDRAIRIEPLGDKFLVEAKRMYVNDSPELVMIMSMLMRRGYEEMESVVCESMFCNRLAENAVAV